MATKEPFLTRLARRKAVLEDELPATESPSTEDEISQSQSDNLVEQTEAGTEEPQKELTDEDMPPIEELDEHSDFSQFMSPGVSEGLRRLALRKLFGLPQFDIRDGLNDYDDDFSNMKPLAAELVEKVRSWAVDKQDELTEKVKDDLLSNDEPSAEAPETEQKTEAATQQPEDNDVGNADLEG